MGSDAIDDWVLVPRIPTFAMKAAGRDALCEDRPEVYELADAWTAMLEAAPKPRMSGDDISRAMFGGTAAEMKNVRRPIT